MSLTGTTGWGEFAGRLIPLLIAGNGTGQWRGCQLDCSSPSFSSHHEVAWRQPRREARAPWVSVAEAQNGDSMKSSGRNLTLAAIEKQSLVAGDCDGKVCEGFRMPAWRERSTRRGPASESLRRRNPREASEQLAGYGDLGRQRRCRGMVCLGIAEG